MHRRPGINFAGLLALLGLFVSITPVSASFSAAYCSTQNTGSGNGNLWDFQSNGWCTDKCSGSAFAILLGKDCWCSNYAPGNGLTDTKDCNDPCAGFPDDKCGNKSKNLYLYLQMSDTAPSGTQGGSSPTSTSTSKVSSVPSTTPPSSSTEASTTPLPARPSSTSTMQTSEAPTTASSTAFSASATVTVTPTPSVAGPSSTAPAPQTTAAPQTSTRIITQSGLVVTQTVVTTPTLSPARDSNDDKSSSSNIGAIVGGVVGGVVAILALAGLIVFLLFRRRKQQQEADQEVGSDGMHRNVSTMSRSGLLRSGNPQMSQYPTPIATSFNTRRQSSHMDQDSISPASDRRNSRHLVDQRLNPSAIMYFDNSSRGSVASIDDSRDYHRPLNVRNPDP